MGILKQTVIVIVTRADYYLLQKNGAINKSKLVVLSKPITEKDISFLNRAAFSKIFFYAAMVKLSNKVINSGTKIGFYLF